MCIYYYLTSGLPGYRLFCFIKHMSFEIYALSAYFLFAIVQDTCRMGVWLGWHICYNATQVSQGQLRENRNLSSSIRAKAVLIYVLSVPVHNEQYLCNLLHSSRVKARPSDPLVYVWILWLIKRILYNISKFTFFIICNFSI